MTFPRLHSVVAGTGIGGHRVIALLLGALASAAPATGPSWGFDAHRLICEIAWRELTPAARERAMELIASDRAYERFSDACIWADLVRGDAATGDLPRPTT
jgi:hypothetical protein